MLSRRNFIHGFTCALLGASVDALYVEPQWLELTRHEVRFAPGKILRPLRVLHLSDLHLSSFVPLEFIRKAIERGLQYNPDICLITGDFITSRLIMAYEYRDLLATLPLHAPTFASMGNHDGGGWAGSKFGAALRDNREMKELLQASNITVLEDNNRRIMVRQQPLQLVGLADIWSFLPQVAQAFDGVDDRDPTIVLAHNPDTKDSLTGRKFDLMLCGHTHGGQLRIPLVDMAPFAPVRDSRYIAGLNPWENKWIFTNRGVGNLAGMRFCCRPEVALLTLV